MVREIGRIRIDQKERMETWKVVKSYLDHYSTHDLKGIIITGLYREDSEDRMFSVFTLGEFGKVEEVKGAIDSMIQFFVTNYSEALSEVEAREKNKGRVV